MAAILINSRDCLNTFLIPLKQKALYKVRRKLAQGF